MKKDTLIILDNGHGGLDKGKYVTAPNKMYKFDDGFTIYEGHFNREIVKKIAYKLKSLGIPFYNLVPGPQDTPLKERVNKANELTDKWNGKAIYISIHGNAGGGTGFEVYTSKGQTKSDAIAGYYMDAMAEEFPDKAARVDLTDGDKDKEANFYVLKNTKCPAILTESFFMDRREDAALMMSYEGSNKIVNAHLKTIQRALEEEPVKKPAPKPKPEPKAEVKPKPTPKPVSKQTPKKGPNNKRKHRKK